MENTIITAGTVSYRVVNGDIEILLVKPAKGNNGWQIPKGHLMMSNNEPVQDAAVRETYEETGIKVSLLDFLGSVKYPVPEGQKIVYAYLSEPTNPNQQISGDGENAEVKWTSITKLQNINKEQSPLIAKGVVLAKQRVENLSAKNKSPQ